MSARTWLLTSICLLAIAGCGKVSRDFKAAGDDARDAMVALRESNLQADTLESRRDAIKRKLEVVTAATQSDRERDAQAALVSLYIQVSMLKEAQMLPPSDGATSEVNRLQKKADSCLTDYEVLVGDKKGDEHGPCVTEAKAAMDK
jgi:hypothetical protein